VASPGVDGNMTILRAELPLLLIDEVVTMIKPCRNLGCYFLDMLSLLPSIAFVFASSTQTGSAAQH
jgi:hypothetical protein